MDTLLYTRHNEGVDLEIPNKNLRELFTTGKNRKYPLDDRVIEDFIWICSIIQAAKDIYDFQKQPSLHFKRLQGKHSGYSFRLGRKYRLEVEIEWSNEQNTEGLIRVLELTNHYEK